MMMMMSKTPIAFAALMLLLSTAAADSGNRLVPPFRTWKWRALAQSIYLSLH